MNKNEFKPMLIGLPDKKKESEIISVYTEICGALNTLLWNFEYYLSDSRIDISVLFDFIKSKDPKAFLYKVWIEWKNISFPGMSIDKIIENDLIDVPRQDFNDILKIRAEVVKSIQKTKDIGFYFPLSKLFHDNGDIRDFALSCESEWINTDEFNKAVFNHTHRFTQSENENKVIESVNKFIDSINDMIDLGIIPQNKNKWEHYLNSSIIDNLVFDHTADKSPIGINPIFLFRGKGGRFFETRAFGIKTGQEEDLLRLEFAEEEKEEYLNDAAHNFEDNGSTEDLNQNIDEDLEESQDSEDVSEMSV